MAGEYRIAQQLLQQALTQAQSDPAQSEQTMASALLCLAAERLLNERSANDIVQELTYHLENLGEQELVVTRGC